MAIQVVQFPNSQRPRVDYDTHGAISDAIGSGLQVGWEIGSSIRQRLDEVQRTVDDRNNRNEAKQLVDAWDKEDNAQPLPVTDANGEQRLNQDGSPMMTNGGINYRQQDLDKKLSQLRQDHDTSKIDDKTFAAGMDDMAQKGLAIQQERIQAGLRRIGENAGNDYVAEAVKPTVIMGMNSIKAFSTNMTNMHNDFQTQLAIDAQNKANQAKMTHEDQQKALDRQNRLEEARIKATGKGKEAKTPEQEQDVMYTKLFGQAAADTKNAVDDKGKPDQNALGTRLDQLGSNYFGDNWSAVKQRNAPVAPKPPAAQPQQAPTSQLQAKYNEAAGHKQAILSHLKDLHDQLENMQPESMATDEGSRKFSRLKQEISAFEDQLNKISGYQKSLEDESSKENQSEVSEENKTKLGAAQQFVESLNK